MKKHIRIALGVLFTISIFSFTSCNKKGDWNCACTVDGNASEYTIHDTKRKDAESECNKHGSLLGVDYDCNLKYL
ncbi:MAG TPA: hypothetical protein VL021_10680 [Brumimicrobium sp.]|nr:hypothetical protein [Brumimicrobium sp.]